MSQPAQRPLPFGMKPAPAKQPKVSPVTDLGKYDEEFRDWCVVVNLDAPISALKSLSDGTSNEILEMAGRDMDELSTEEKVFMAQQGLSQIKSLQNYISECIVAWNFTRVLPDGTVEPLPQPYEGGVDHLSSRMIGLLMGVINELVKPSKNLGKR